MSFRLQIFFVEDIFYPRNIKYLKCYFTKWFQFLLLRPSFKYCVGEAPSSQCLRVCLSPSKKLQFHCNSMALRSNNFLLTLLNSFIICFLIFTKYIHVKKCNFLQLLSKKREHLDFSQKTYKGPISYKKLRSSPKNLAT